MTKQQDVEDLVQLTFSVPRSVRDDLNAIKNEAGYRSQTVVIAGMLQWLRGQPLNVRTACISNGRCPRFKVIELDWGRFIERIEPGADGDGEIIRKSGDDDGGDDGGEHQIPDGLWEAFGHYLEAEGVVDSDELRWRVLLRLLRWFLFEVDASKKASIVWPERDYDNRRGEEDLWRASCDPEGENQNSHRSEA